MRMVFVTGVSGYIGKSFVKNSRDKFKVAGLDIKQDEELAGVEFFKEDVRSERVKEILLKIKPDSLLHLVYIFNPPEDRDAARSVNVDGTKNVLGAALKAGVRQVVVLSSATSYGAHPDNRIPLKEDSPLRGDLNKGFWYSEDKVLQEKMVREFAKENPEIKVAVARACIVLGENVENFISQCLFNPPFSFIPDGDIPFQFIDEDDIAIALSKIIEKEACGAFNIAGSEYIRFSEMAGVMAKRAVKIPNSQFIHKPLLWFLKKTGMVDWNIPLALMHFLSYPWIVDTGRAREELGFTPKYTSEETFKRAYEAWTHKKEIAEKKLHQT